MSISFSEAAADTLIDAATNAASRLRGQGFLRHGVVSHTVEEFSGGYATSFTAACAVEAEDRGKLAGKLDDLISDLRDAKQKAQEEKDRIKDLAAWREREAEREKLRALAPASGGDPLIGSYDQKPSEYPIAPPTITAPFTAREHSRVVSAFGGGRTSADPDRLRYFVTNTRTLNAALSDELTALRNAWAGFRATCSWVQTETVTFLGGFGRLITENENDVSWIDSIATAFEKAGRGTLSDFDVALATSDEHPQSAQDLLLNGNLTPEQVATVWAALEASPAVNTDALLRKHADVFGELDGLPALARVQANQYRVPALLKAAEADLEAARMADKVDPERIKFLENEIGYLKEVASGEVQLYLYDRDNSRIIEMIGTPGPDTVRAVTYVPGTYTGMNSFFEGGVQQVSQYLGDNLEGTVAFVYKDGLFPGETHGRAVEPELTRILEANKKADALEAGKQLASFEVGMRADPALNGVEQIGIGHSWGLANLICSEEAGARYDKVISLAGAGMPKGWEPKTGTEYSNLYYYDILIHAQTKKVVWSGNNPVSSSDFDQYYYRSSNTDKLKGNFINTKEELDALMDNHNLITTTKAENQNALDNLKRIIGRTR